MLEFRKDFYADLRIEYDFETEIIFLDGELNQNKYGVKIGAFIRVFDGEMWYYSSTTDVENLNSHLKKLYKLGKPNKNILENPIVKNFEIHKGEFLKFKDSTVQNIKNEKKISLLKDYLKVYDDFPEILSHKDYYKDKYKMTHFVSSLGSDLKHDTQFLNLVFTHNVNLGEAPFNGMVTLSGRNIEELKNRKQEIISEFREDIEYAKNAVKVNPGKYTCVLSPITAGVFAHESFGHKSESDFMIGDETMLKEWEIGKKVGSDILSIVDSGDILDAGFMQFDDEGNKSKKTYLIKNGILKGRLHNSYTASYLDEDITGNGRAVSFEFEPIVRMTNTYIESGDMSFKELIEPIKEGIFIKDINHGSGMSTFTIAPNKAYMIRDGKIKEPVRIAVITGNVMHTLSEIDGLSDEVKLYSFALGGCGKMEQYPLKVGIGGPYVRVNNIEVK
ncbi:MAG: TldD/PmbA family protein [Tissierellia bacterium]|nr:TldD/PmbA family protein [Tissierellia bacterium]